MIQKNYSIKTLVVLLALIIGSLKAQTYPNGMPLQRTCGSADPGQQWDSWFNQKVTEYVQNNSAKIINGTNQTAATAYTIPVVVHVVHGGQAVGTYPNITNAQVVSQINILTADFGGTGQYTSHYPANAFQTYATANSIPAPSYNGTRIIIGNAQLTFIPAYYDKNGNAMAEPGVDRVNFNTFTLTAGYSSKDPANAAYNSTTTFQNFMNNIVKPQTIWNPAKYMNIWVTDENSSLGLLGFATFPAGTGLTGITGGTGTSTTDGLWCWARSYGNTGFAAAPYNLGRTATHEIGHWVGLRHIWGDANCGTDYCNDTPPAATANYVNQNTIASPATAADANTVSYPYLPNNCTGTGTTGVMFMNFMDYSDDNAMYMFTTDQVTRIQTAMANAPLRNQLGTHGLTIPPPVANFSVNATTICAGSTATITDMSVGSPATPTAWNYTVTGATTTTANVQNPVFTFTATGTQTITLIAVANATQVSLPVKKTVTVGSGITVSVTASSSSICVGSTATLTASGATTYTWNTGSNATAIAVTPTATTVYTVNGVSGTCSGLKTFTVTVNSTPTVSVNSSTVCAGSSVVLTASGATTYSWSTGATTSTVSVAPTANTSYTVTGANGSCTNSKISNVSVNASPTVAVSGATVCSGTAANLTASGATTYSWNTGATTASVAVTPTANTNYTVTGTTNGCTNTKTVSVTVKATPTVSAASATVCSGTAANLTASGATTYSWNTGATTASVAVTPTANTNYTVTGTTNGCTNTKTVSVTVKATPTVSAASATVCSGTAANLTASGATTYSWNTGATTASVAVTPTATTIYTVTGTANGCSNAKTVTVNVNALPNVSSTSSTICAGATATLTASGASTYSWNTGAVGASLVVSPSANTVYTVTGTSAAGCIKSVTASVVVGAAPVITVNSSAICAGETATLTANGVSTYTWNTGSNNSSITVAPSVTSTYSVSGNLAGCTTMATKVVTVVVNQLPAVTMGAITSPLCANSPAENLTGTPAGGSFSGTGVSASTFDPAVSGSGTFTITYAYTDANNCSNNAVQTVSVSLCTGIEELAGTSVQIFPNPANDVITAKVNSELVGNTTLEMYDATGKLVLVQTISNEQTVMPVSQLAHGIYSIRMLAGGKQQVIHIVKE